MLAKPKDRRSSENEGFSFPPLSRRGFLMAAGAGALMGIIGCTQKAAEVPVTTSAPVKTTAPPKYEVPPGKWDDYIAFWSGGHSGEVRLIGIPSMRVLLRIPVFNFDCTKGWGVTEDSKALLGDFRTGDTHHPHLSYTDGTYDGRYAYVQDKINARVARIRLDYMEPDAIIEVPNVQGIHGLFPQRFPKTGYVFCNSEFQTPMPNDGRDFDKRDKYYGLHTAIDGEKMEVKWQVLTDGNQDLCATDYKGRFSMATSYNSEKGFVLEEMMEKDRDYVIVFNTKNIEKAIANGEYMEIGDSPVPVVDGRRNSPLYGEAVLYIPVPKSPHGINVTPDGKYAIANGKLSPTCTVIDLDKVEEAFAGKIKPEETIVAQPELGLGPLHTQFDGRGNAYTTLFIDSQICKWNIEKAIRQYRGENVDPIVEKLDVHYQPGHCQASMGETKEADGKWLVSLNKFSKDRFAPVGPLHPDNDQLISISGDKMVLVKDEPVWPEPHNCVIVRRDIIERVVKKIPNMSDFPVKTVITVKGSGNSRYRVAKRIYGRASDDERVTSMDKARVERVGEREVHVYMASRAPVFSPTSFKVKEGDKVRLIVTNLDKTEDLTHGVGIPRHNVNFIVNPQETRVVEFTAGLPGVYWYYCTWFCHALHLEMRGRMIVEPR
jgi:nitrous-oxide reductase